MSTTYVQYPQSGGTGSGGGVLSLNTLTGNVTLAQGLNITLTPVGQTITIAASGGGITGSVSLVNQVVGILPAANLPAGTQIGSVNLVNQVSGILPAANLPSGTIIGSVNLTNQVSGNLPISQTSGSVTNSQLQTQYVIGVGPFGSQAASASGGTIVGSAIFFQAATATLPGQVSSNSQTFSGIKTFSQPMVLNANGSASTADGTFFYDNTVGGLTFQNNIASSSLQIGQEQWVRVYNNSSATIVNGRAVYVTGAASLALGGDTPTVALAIATTQSTSQFLGASTHDIGNGQFGFVAQQGKVHGLDTTGFGSGQRVWLSTASAGFYQSADPQPPFYSVFAGYVLDIGSTTGSMFLSGIRSGTQKPFINPMTTSGDMITSSGSGNAVRVGIGNPGQYLTVASGSASLPAWTTFTGLINPMTTSGDIIVGSGTGTAARLAGTVGSLSYLSQTGSGGSSALPTWKPFLPPTITKFTTLGSASYTVPAGVLYIRVRMVGGGGGGGGSGTLTTAGDGTAGSSSIFGTAFLVANGGGLGLGGRVGSVVGGGGGSGSLGSSSGIILNGGRGGSGNTTTVGTAVIFGGSGGSTGFGSPIAQSSTAGADAGFATLGGGGAGAGNGETANVFSGSGGGGGGSLDAFIYAPTVGTTGGIFAIIVGTGGALGSAGTTGNAGGAGGAGQILIEEHYQ